MKLNGKVAIVTAAGRGIGKGIALALAREGADIVVNSYREETARAVSAEIEAIGRKTLFVAGDITRPDKIMQLADEAIKTFGRIDILVNNVGGGGAGDRKPGSEPLAEEVLLWDSRYEQNLRAPVLMCEAIIPHFKEQNSGKIINIASVSGRAGMPFASESNAVYGCMKAGLIRYTQLLADRLGASNINANCICPGLVYTDVHKVVMERAVQSPKFQGYEPRQLWLEAIEGKRPEWNWPNIPLKRDQTVEDIAQAVVFLASDNAVNITGQALNIDGGIIKS